MTTAVHHDCTIAARDQRLDLIAPVTAVAEAAMQEEFGDLLFALVNMSRFLNIRAEEAMEQACNKFIRRFTAIERSADAQGRHLKDMTLAEMDELWNEVKRGEKQG
jgi:XTP/dITP diphosphohydrolase